MGSLPDTSVQAVRLSIHYKKKKKEIRNNLNAVHGGSLEKPKLNMRGIQAAVTQFGQIELLMLFMTYRNGSFVRFEL